MNSNGKLNTRTPPRRSNSLAVGANYLGNVYVPTDILDQIMSYLEPLDVLHLSRVSTYLRGTLMTSQAKHVWRKARENVGMPECPKDISEPRYASLVAEDICSSCCCGSTEIFPELKLRFCSSCYRTKLGRRSETGEKQAELFTMVSCHSAIGYYSLSDFEAVLTQYQRLSHDKQALNRFVDSRKTIVQEGKQFAADLEAWVNTKICKMFLDMGYEETDLPCFPWSMDIPVILTNSWNELIKRSMDDPDEDYWESVLRFDFEKLIQENMNLPQRKHLYRLRQLSRFGEFVVHLHAFSIDISQSGYIMPAPPKILRLPVVQELLSEDKYRIPLTRERFDGVVGQLRQVIEEFTFMIRKELALLFIAGDSHSAASTPSEYRDLLELATTLFYCENCSKFFHYLELCHHPCAQRLDQRRNTASMTSEMVQKYLSVKPSTATIGRQVLMKLGIPENCVHEDLKELETNKRLFCPCGHPRFENPATFTELVGHIVQENVWYEEKNASRLGRTRRSDPKNSNTRLINDHDLSVLSPRLLAAGEEIHDTTPMNQDEPLRVPSSTKWTYCLLCLELTGTREFLRGDKRLTEYHMKAKHGVGC